LRLVRILLSTAFAGITWGAVAAIPAAERQVLFDLYSAPMAPAGLASRQPDGRRWQRMRVGGVTCDAGQTTVLRST
jgi:hypothetical protein